MVLGAGPAGLAAALWCAELGLAAVVLEREPVAGGQLLRWPAPVANLPGVAVVTGSELCDTLLGQLASRRVELRLGQDWAFAPHGPLELRWGDEVLRPAAVIVATGVRRRALGVPGETHVCVRDNVGAALEAWAGKDVVIVGGGDDAFEHAQLLAPIARSVTLLHRRPTFTAREHFRAPVLADPRVRVLAPARVVAVHPRPGTPEVEVTHEEGRAMLPADVLFRCIGPEPASDLGGVPRRPDGSLDVDALQRTLRAGVFAVGDVCSTEAPTLPTAFGQGATAAKAALAWIEGRSVWREDSAAQPSVDVLRIEGIVLPASVGVYASEHGILQPLRFDLAFGVDARAAALRDELSDTIDYAAVRACVHEVVARGHVCLIEALAERVAREVRARFSLVGVRVRVTKIDVPQAGATASVEVVRGLCP